ncbi:MAG: hypothetical protein ACT4P6_17055, partial [Gemmatimonadaceae bacterium]
NDSEVAAVTSLANGDAGAVSPGTVLNGSAQHVFDFLVRDVMADDMRLTSHRVDVESKQH